MPHYLFAISRIFVMLVVCLITTMLIGCGRGRGNRDAIAQEWFSTYDDRESRDGDDGPIARNGVNDADERSSERKERFASLTSSDDQRRSLLRSLIDQPRSKSRFPIDPFITETDTDPDAHVPSGDLLPPLGAADSADRLLADRQRPDADYFDVDDLSDRSEEVVDNPFEPDLDRVADDRSEEVVDNPFEPDLDRVAAAERAESTVDTEDSNSSADDLPDAFEDILRELDADEGSSRAVADGEMHAARSAFGERFEPEQPVLDLDDRGTRDLQRDSESGSRQLTSEDDWNAVFSSSVARHETGSQFGDGPRGNTRRDESGVAPRRSVADFFLDDGSFREAPAASQRNGSRDFAEIKDRFSNEPDSFRSGDEPPLARDSDTFADPILSHAAPTAGGFEHHDGLVAFEPRADNEASDTVDDPSTAANRGLLLSPQPAVAVDDNGSQFGDVNSDTTGVNSYAAAEQPAPILPVLADMADAEGASDTLATEAADNVVSLPDGINWDFEPAPEPDTGARWHLPWHIWFVVVLGLLVILRLLSPAAVTSSERPRNP